MKIADVEGDENKTTAKADNHWLEVCEAYYEGLSLDKPAIIFFNF